MKNEAIAQTGIKITSCNECSKNNIGTKIYELFAPTFARVNYFIRYKDGKCYINEQVLMSLIRMANPHKKDREIIVVSQEEFMNLRIGKEV